MAADVHRRARSPRDVASLPGWLQALVTLSIAAAIVLVAHLAGIPGYWAPLVIGGSLGLLTALVAGAPPRADDSSRRRHGTRP